MRSGPAAAINVEESEPIAAETKKPDGSEDATTTAAAAFPALSIISRRVIVVLDRAFSKGCPLFCQLQLHSGFVALL